MNVQYRTALEKNIVKYSWYKIFTKRIYLPLIAIQLVSVGKVTVEEIALIAAITSVVSFTLQIPTGYFADKWGNKRSLVIGAAISIWSPLFYIFMPDFWGGLIASLLFFGGYAFQSGAIEAFMHDTLQTLGREKDYSKVMGRAQSYGLIGNIFLIAAVPATYGIHQSLPFILGFISLVAMLLLIVSFRYPDVKIERHTRKKSPFSAIHSIVTIENVALFIFVGFTTGVANKSGLYQELLLQDIGVPIILLGVVTAASNIIGAILGYFIHIFDRLRAATFYLIDLTIVTGALIVIGVLHEPILTTIAFVLSFGWWRVRQIIFQAKLLHDVRHAYKATLVSALSLFSTVGDVIAIAALGKLIGLYDYNDGYAAFGVAAFGVAFVLWLSVCITNPLTRQRVTN